jgi:cytochrome b subunit of formate dehydrogenase
VRALWNVALAGISLIVGGSAAAVEPAGSPLPQQENHCATCHGEEALWEGDNQRLFLPADELAEDVHRKNGVSCHDCHGGNPGSFNVPEAHAAEVDDGEPNIRPFKPALSQQGRSPERLITQMEVCGRCHAQAVSDYRASVHGHGLHEAGLVVTAVCTDCHGSHKIYASADPRSTLHAANVSATCATCHRFIHERVQRSVHGQGQAGSESPATLSPNGAAGNDSGAASPPSCIDCHEGHDLPHPRTTLFQLTLPERCGNCHAEMMGSYARSRHGKLTELGYMPAARCADCHGAHDILPVADPASPLSAVNRRATCAKCHPGANDNFLDFDPHADPSNSQRNALLYWVNVGLTGLLTAVFFLFGIHSILWLVRSLPHVAKHGRPKRAAPGAKAYVRFRPVHRIAHAVMMTSFLGLVLTGLPLRFSHLGWAQAVTGALGGFSSTGLWHRIFGIANFSCLVFYVFWFGGLLIMGPGTGISRFRYIFSPDSPVPARRDVSDFVKMLRWFVGRGPKPTFERWTYWEKFDLWAAGADIILIGTTGFILWFPNQFSALLPGRALNIADLVHGKLALLATGFVFAIHFFSATLRPEKFPMDISIFTGVVSEGEMAEERPEYLRRLRKAGELREYLVEAPSSDRLRLAMLSGAVALGAGLVLLIGMLVAVFSLR